MILIKIVDSVCLLVSVIMGSYLILNTYLTITHRETKSNGCGSAIFPAGILPRFVESFSNLWKRSFISWKHTFSSWNHSVVRWSHSSFCGIALLYSGTVLLFRGIIPWKNGTVLSTIGTTNLSRGITIFSVGTIPTARIAVPRNQEPIPRFELPFHGIGSHPHGSNYRSTKPGVVFSFPFIFPFFTGVAVLKSLKNKILKGGTICT